MKAFASFFLGVLFAVILAVTMDSLNAATDPPDLDILPKKVELVICSQKLCPPCVKLKGELQGRKFDFVVTWIDVRRNSTYKVKSTPTLIKVVDGKEVTRKEGFMTAAEVIAFMK